MSNQYNKYNKPHQKNPYSRSNTNNVQSLHSRAATYAKSKAHGYKNKPAHLPSNSIAATSNATLNDIDTTRSDMRDILWQNAELLQSDPNYRKKVWRYMSKVFYGNQSNAYNFDVYKKFQLPSSNRSAAASRANKNDNNKPKGTDNNTLGIASNPNGAQIGGEEEKMTKEKLKLLLDREETYSDFLINSNPNQVILMNKVRPKMERILEAYACANQNKLDLSGAVQLCAVILTTFNATNKPSTTMGGGGGMSDDQIDNGLNDMNINYSNNSGDCQDTFFILQILTQIMQKYSDDDEKLMKDETLLLIDVLCVNEDKLVRKLNSLEIDVIDLSVFVSSWIRCLFVHHFEIEFVQRVIDLVLLEGPSVLIAIVYGILQFIKNDILQCNTHYDVFEKLAGNKLKNYLKKHEFIHRVIQKAQLLFTEENYKYVIKGRAKKSWPELLGLPGKRHFRIAKGVGDKTKVKKAYQHWRRESRKNITSAYLGAEESSDDSEEEDETNGGSHHARTSSTGFYNHSSFNDDYSNGNDGMYKSKLHEMEMKLQAANDTITRLKSGVSHHGFHGYSDSMGIHSQPIPEEEQIPSGPTSMIEHNNSIIIHSGTTDFSINTGGDKQQKDHKTASSQLAAQKQSGGGSKHNKSAPTLSDILYTSQLGDTIYQEPIGDNLAPREIQCRTENWTDSWKNALNSLTDASISMQGYLCKMTASKWNSRGTLDKIQRRWFVLRGNYMTYYKTNLHTQPKSDKCVNLLGYTVNPVIHNKSKNAFELISPPKENIHKKSKSKKASMSFAGNNRDSNNAEDFDVHSPRNHQSHHSNQYSTEYYERTKFVLIPDLDVNGDIKQREIRDKWVKSLRLATKGAFLWDVLLNLQVENNGGSGNIYDEGGNNGGGSSPSHSKHSSSHTNSQSAYVPSSSSAYHNPHNLKNNRSNHRGTSSRGTSSRHQPSMSGNNSNRSSNNDNNNSSQHSSTASTHYQYNRRQYSNNNNNRDSNNSSRRKVGGNTQDYPDFGHSSSNKKGGY